MLARGEAKACGCPWGTAAIEAEDAGCGDVGGGGGEKGFEGGAEGGEGGGGIGKGRGGEGGVAAPSGRNGRGGLVGWVGLFPGCEEALELVAIDWGWGGHCLPVLVVERQVVGGGEGVS